MNFKNEIWMHPQSLPGVEKIVYTSDIDGTNDWALALRPQRGQTWVVGLHGHGSTGDQIYTRPDIRGLWLSNYLRLGLGVLSPHLRGNAWMCPEAVADLHHLLDYVRERYGARKFLFLSASMGASGNLIYATVHPEDVALVAALCPVTDIVSYHAWCRGRPEGICNEIRLAIESAYGGSPDQVPLRYEGHVVLRHADRLTMPVLFSHAIGDSTIPVEQSRNLRQRLADAPNVTYVEQEGGNHDTPLQRGGMMEWLDQQTLFEALID